MNLHEKPFYLNDTQIKWVNEQLASLTNRQKVGQLFCVMGGDYAGEERLRLVEEYGVGGVLFRPAPSKDIRAWYDAMDKKAAVPLLKAANLEEGGYGAISDGTMFGYPMTVAATDDMEMVKKFAAVCAAEAMSVGINITFSPVSDIDMNYLNPITNVRTYGSDPDRVREMCRTYVETLQSFGMSACAKHFPGDGVDYRDQHLHPTYNSLSAEDWYASYGQIYKTLIDGGLMSVMVGHIVQPHVAREINPTLTDEELLPASQSVELLQGILRGRLGFNGVIFSDATIMGGYCMTMERAKAIPLSIACGCDMLVFSTNFYEDYQCMLRGLENGLLTQERLDEAVTRILALKARVCFTKTPDRLPPSHTWREECADKSVTLVKSKDEILPISPERFPHIRLIILGNDVTIDGSLTKMAVDKLSSEGFQVELYDPYADDLHGSMDLPPDRLTLYFANLTQASNQTVVRINWCPKHALDIPRFIFEEHSVMVSFANPYLLQDVPRIRTYINAYTATESTVDAVISKLLGKSAFKGVSPVDPFCGLLDTRL